ncbi:hypothetical protein [Neobacillus piezotolerans]|uniref:hypothetical protein n=1 Tax=Neobacillus piezotolerans TaxID=2259171 RepID=UPI00115854A9|nr:hypothetical protein [Neobacillus piezotolerans]
MLDFLRIAIGAERKRKSFPTMPIPGGRAAIHCCSGAKPSLSARKNDRRFRFRTPAGRLDLLLALIHIRKR